MSRFSRRVVPRPENLFARNSKKELAGPHEPEALRGNEDISTLGFKLPRVQRIRQIVDERGERFVDVGFRGIRHPLEANRGLARADDARDHAFPATSVWKNVSDRNSKRLIPLPGLTQDGMHLSPRRTAAFASFGILWLSLLLATVVPGGEILTTPLTLGILLVLGAVLFLPEHAAPHEAAPVPSRAPAKSATPEEDSIFELVTVTPAQAMAEASHKAPLRERELEVPLVTAAPQGTFFPVDGNGTATAKVTKGMCGRCGTKLTLSARRPLRATCPVCGNSKVLN